MSSRLLDLWSSTLRGGLSQRDIYVTDGARATRITVSPLGQAGLLAATIAVIGWAGFATYQATEDRSALVEVREALARTIAGRDARLAAAAQDRSALSDRLRVAERDRERLEVEIADIQRLALGTAATKAALQSELDELRSAFAVALAESADTSAMLAGLQDRAAQLAQKLAIAERSEAASQETLAVLGETVDGVLADRDAALRQLAAVDAQRATLRQELAVQTERKERLVSQLEAAARESLESFEGIFSETKIDADRIIAALEPDTASQGGPFEALEGMDGGAREAGDLRVAGLFNDLERISLMRHAMHRLPFSYPVEGARITSGFGPRRDPIRRRNAMHNGTDFKGQRGTPIHATAEGVVTFAGRQRGYGNVVKIRHAFGFETVYAHLNRARVKVGQSVARGDRIGDMGSTGRATGVHLHYEVRIDNKPVNAMKFIEAARDVL